MILTSNNDSTKPVTSADIRTLAGCDEARSYTECGWYCLIGYKDGRRVVHAHAHKAEDFAAMAEGMGYRWTGWEMVAMTREERMARPSAYARYAA